MPALSVEERTRLGLRAAGGHMYHQDKVWSRHSNDKVDIAGALARVLRTLNKALPLHEPLRALSIGSSNEPQFRILESAFRGGLYLLDIEAAALAVVEERVQRQNTPPGPGHPRQLSRGTARHGVGPALSRRASRWPAHDADHAPSLALL
jgi:hypothetical protein